MRSAISTHCCSNNGDVLRLYALTGLLLRLCCASRGGMLIAVAVLAAVHLGALGWFALSWLRFWWDAQQGIGDPPRFHVAGEFGVDPAAVERGLAMGRESLAERIARRPLDGRGR